MSKFSKPKAIIIDIEGTTTDSKYISKVLFPFIRNNLLKFLSETYETPETKEVVNGFRRLGDSNKYSGMPSVANGNKAQVIDSINNCILWQMNKKKKESVLKQLELLCWLWGYETGGLKGHVFSDVSYALHDWKHKQSIKIYTYSSGLICAQKLMFANTNHGNIYCLIDQFFDNSIGDKNNSQSYKDISAAIKVSERHILFVTDSGTEAKAAVSAGLKAVIIKRSGNKATSEVSDVPTVTSFAEIKF